MALDRFNLPILGIPVGQDQTTTLRTHGIGSHHIIAVAMAGVDTIRYLTLRKKADINVSHLVQSSES
jgi:hypothetical protein